MTAEQQWHEDLVMPEWAEELVSVLEFLLKQLFDGERFVSLYVTNDIEMRELNLEHRKKDRTTDVLSWSYYEEDSSSQQVGDLAVSWDQVLRQADVNGWDAKTEMIRLLVHGCAHLVGLDHERSPKEAAEMLVVEDKLLSALGLPDLYPTTESS